MKPVRHTQEMIDRYVREGFWGNPNTAELWDRNAELYPDREVLVDRRLRITWSEGKILMDRLALGFRQLGLTKDDIVVMQLPNMAEAMLARVALLKAGGISMPIMMFFRQRELLYALNYVDAAAIITCREHRGFDYAAMIADLRPQLPSLRQHLVVDDETLPGTISLRAMMHTPLERDYPPDYLRQFRFPVGEVTQLLRSEEH